MIVLIRSKGQRLWRRMLRLSGGGGGGGSRRDPCGLGLRSLEHTGLV